jgi:oxygen-dependent protoporphyrinogen oxidase
MTRFLILGGGITGLSAAWFLQKKYPNAHITLLEKEDRLGGWIRTSFENGFLFEKGPRTFQKARSPHLLNLIQELGLETLSSDPVAAKRFLLYRGRLCTPGSFLFRFFPDLIRELFVPSSSSVDESIYDFASRRFSHRVAETLFDPLTLGIYGGDIRKLSIRSCFPAFYKWEKEKGSVLRGLFSSPKQEKGLFTLKNGMQSLIQELQKRLRIDFVLNCPVEEIKEKEVIAGGKVWRADRVINALPPPFPTRSLWVVNLGYTSHILPRKAFGYLVPTQERESVLGVIFDSAIFPEQNKGDQTRLTVMVRPEENEPLKVVLDALKRHLQLFATPSYTSVFLAQNAIPQFEVGCQYTGGVSVDACIQRAQDFCIYPNKFFS